MRLIQRHGRQRSLRGSTSDAVEADVLGEETRQLNVALPVELHHRVKVTTTQEGISVRAWTARAMLYYFANPDKYNCSNAETYMSGHCLSVVKRWQACLMPPTRFEHEVTHSVLWPSSGLS